MFMCLFWLFFFIIFWLVMICFKKLLCFMIFGCAIMCWCWGGWSCCMCFRLWEVLWLCGLSFMFKYGVFYVNRWSRIFICWINWLKWGGCIVIMGYCFICMVDFWIECFLGLVLVSLRFMILWGMRICFNFMICVFLIVCGCGFG